MFNSSVQFLVYHVIMSGCRYQRLRILCRGGLITFFIWCCVSRRFIINRVFIGFLWRGTLLFRLLQFHNQRRKFRVSGLFCLSRGTRVLFCGLFIEYGVCSVTVFSIALDEYELTVLNLHKFALRGSQLTVQILVLYL